VSGGERAPRRSGGPRAGAGNSGSTVSVGDQQDAGKPSTALARLEDYDPRRFIVLHPVMLQTREGWVAPVLYESVSVVQINPEPAAGDVYHEPRYAPESKGVVALTAQGLAKIAAAAGIQWDPAQCRILARHRTPDGHVYVAYQAVGQVRQPNGEWHQEVAVADLDTADEEEQRLDQYRRKLKREGERARFKAGDIPSMVQRDLLQLRQFALRHVETKAKNRVIRRLLSLPQTGPKQEWQKPVVVPRVLYRPELVDAAGAAKAGREAADDLYGPPPPPRSEGPVATGYRRGGSEGDAPTGDEAAGPSDDTGREPQAAEGKVSTVSGAGTRSEPQPLLEPDAPPDDPFIEKLLGASTPHDGKRLSEVAEFHPDFLRGIAAGHRRKAVREMAQAWLDYYHPTLG
jgi:hypothetical protein